MDYAGQTLAGAIKPAKTPGCLADPTITSSIYFVKCQLANVDANCALWVVFATLFITSQLRAGLSGKVPLSRQLHHLIAGMILVTAALSYFAIATDGGIKLRCVADRASRHTSKGQVGPAAAHELLRREADSARYVDQSSTAPLLSLSLLLPLLGFCLLAGINGAHIILGIMAGFIVFLSTFFAVSTGFFVHLNGYYSTLRMVRIWVWYIFASPVYAAIVAHTGMLGTRMVTAKGTRAARLFRALAAYALVLWTGYPIVRAVADGSPLASANSDILRYAILDVLANPVFVPVVLVFYRTYPRTTCRVNRGPCSHRRRRS